MPPRQVAASASLLPHDIALGRGGMTNNHGKHPTSIWGLHERPVVSQYPQISPFVSVFILLAGNIAFRRTIAQHQEDYWNARFRADKAAIIKEVQGQLQDEGFRFVVKDRNGLWVDAPFRQCRLKVAQALREQAPKIQWMRILQEALYYGNGKGAQKLKSQDTVEKGTRSQAIPEPRPDQFKPVSSISVQANAPAKECYDTEPLPFDYYDSSTILAAEHSEIDEEYVGFCFRLSMQLANPAA